MVERNQQPAYLPRFRYQGFNLEEVELREFSSDTGEEAGEIIFTKGVDTRGTYLAG